MKRIVLALSLLALAGNLQAQNKKGPDPKNKEHAAAPGHDEPPAAIDPGIAGKDDGPPAEKIFTSVERMPEFPGGMPALMQYLGSNIRYPKEAIKEGVQGKVFVKFVVDRDGKIINAVVVRDIGAGCGNEALRVVRSMPAWSPGQVNGSPVKVFYTLPVTFTLSQPNPVPQNDPQK